MTLGQRISQYRKGLGISQEELGARLGVSRQAVSKWETSAAAPDMENLLALAREFGISVAELTETPEPQDVLAASPPRRGWWAALGALIAAILVLLGVIIYWCVHINDGQVSKMPEPVHGPSEWSDTEQTPPIPYPASDFALLWTNTNGDEEFLELGEQEGFFPFGTSLERTAPEEVLDTDYHLTELHKTVCGAVNMDYLHIGEDLDLDPESTERESIIRLSSIAPSVRTPRGIHVGSTKAEVTAAYGDELVYCLKEEGGYTLVQHDEYYVYQTVEHPTFALLFFLKDGLVASIRVEDVMDLGLDAYAPNNVSRFPVVDGEPDFSQRVEPERENVDDTQKVYIAWNQLVTNNNLSAEEQYAYRRDVFSLLPNINWTDFGQMGAAGEVDTRFALMGWLADQDAYSSAEMRWLQQGTENPGIDGAYTDMYAHVLFRAFCSDPIAFAKALSADGASSETMLWAVRLTAYDADSDAMALSTALQSLDAAIASGEVFYTERETGWAKLLRLYLVTDISDRNELPQVPSDMT